MVQFLGDVFDGYICDVVGLFDYGVKGFCVDLEVQCYCKLDGVEYLEVVFGKLFIWIVDGAN